MPVNIHGKQYITVNERINLAGENLLGVETEVLQYDPVVVVKATINYKGQKFSGISSANPAKLIEKTNPFEVAETSAVGRALGFAGIGIEGGIASADEMTKYPDAESSEQIGKRLDNTSGCEVCHAPAGKPHASSCTA